MAAAEAAKYVEQLIAQQPELGEHLDQLLDFHRRRLWHQLSQKLNTFVNDPVVKEKVDLVQFYLQFVKSFEARLNQLSLARLVVDIQSKISDLQARIQFIKNLTEIKNVDENNEAYIYARSILAELYIVSKDLDAAKNALNEAKTKLDQTSGADASVFAAFHRAWAAYYKTTNDPENFYSSALQYLGYVQLETLSKQELNGLAFDLGLSALLGEKIYNFGEFMQHPILDTLKDSENSWLRDILLSFNSGNIDDWNKQKTKYVNELNQRQALKEKQTLLEDKIAILCLIDLVFNKPSQERRIRFDEISSATNLKLNQVEFLVMRALSLGLLKGTIDEVDKTVEITWVQPRILDLNQISSMRKRLATWSDKVKDSLTLMENQVTPDLIA